MSKKEETTALVPVKTNNLPAPVKKGQLKTPFSLVDEAIYLNNRKDVKAILPDVLGRVLARIWIDAEFRDAFTKEPQKTLENHGIFLPDEMSLEFQKPNSDRPRIVVYEKKPGIKFRLRVLHLQLIMIAGR
tara:strand:- start:1767 stop:2159 length:393 start_codon:yes stop_codon:yes gene_type:complete